MFTDEEIQSVVEKLLPSTVARGYTALGTRRTSQQLSKIQQSAAAVLLLYPDSPYYLASLLASDIVGDVRALGEQCARVTSLVAALRRRSVPVNDISAMSNARAALVELESVVQGDAPSDISKVPSFNRFELNVNRFLKKVASNVRQKGQVVYTREEAHQLLPSEVEQLLSSLESLIQRVDDLTNAQTDYHEVDLARRVSTQVVQNARSVLAAREAELASLGPQERLTTLREAVLELLAVKGVVRTFGSFPKPSQGIELFGQGGPFADSTRPAVGGEITCRPGPYYMTRGNTEGDSRNLLYLRLGGPVRRIALTASIAGATVTRGSGSFLADGVAVGDRVYVTSGPSAGAVRRIDSVGATTLTYSGAVLPPGSASISIIVAPDVSLYLPATPLPTLRGSAFGTLTVVAGTNDSMRFRVNGGAPVNATFPVGPQTTTTLATAIATALTGSPFTAGTYFLTMGFEGPVIVSGNNLTLSYGNFPPLMQVGDRVRFIVGENAGIERTVTALSPSPSNCTTVTVSGGALSAALSDHVQIGRDEAIWVYPTNPLTSLLNDDRVLLEPLVTAEQGAGVLLGMPGSQLGRGQPASTSLLAEYINANNAKVSARVAYTSISNGHVLRSDTSDTRRIVAVRASGRVTLPAGTSMTFSDGGQVRNSTPMSGDRLILRSGPSLGVCGTVTGATPSSITVTFDSPISAGEHSYELGSSFSGTLVRGMAVLVPEGVNSGSYLINEINPQAPFEVTMQSSLAVSRDFNTHVTVPGYFATEQLVLSARAKVLPASIALFNPTSTFSLTPEGATSYGTTNHFRVPQANRSLTQGDLLQLYTSSTTTPAVEAVVEEVGGDLVLQLDRAVSEFPPLYTFAGADVAPTPSARAQNARTYDFRAFRELLLQWRDTSPARSFPAYKAELSRVTNLALRSSNPTQLECGDVDTTIQQLYETLTEVGAAQGGVPVAGCLESILGTYQVEKETEVEALLRTFKDQGANRAYDMLLGCKFTQFFGVSGADMSYGGAMQSAIREISIEDMPVDKFDRSNASSGDLVSSSPSADYEYDVSDSDNVGHIDTPE